MPPKPPHPPPPAERQTLRAAETLSRVAPLISRIVERSLAAHQPPLTLAQYLALQALAGGDLIGAELSRQAAVSPAAISQLLSSLEELGLLERSRVAADRRRQDLRLSAAGRRVLRSAEAMAAKQLAALLGGLPAPEADRLNRTLERLEGLLAGTAPPPRPPHPRPPKPPRPGLGRPGR